MSKWFEKLFSKKFKDVAPDDVLTIGKAEKQLQKNKTVSIESPKSFRYMFDDPGSTIEELERRPNQEPYVKGGALYPHDAEVQNANKSTRSGMFTPRQVDDSQIPAMDMNRRNINSTAIERIKYNPKSKIAQVWFVGGDGTGYAFPKVPKEKVEEWLRARSKGEFYNSDIKQYAEKGFRGEA